MASRFAALLAALWAGVLACLGLMAAPTAFANLPVSEAGRFAGHLFAQEAYMSLSLSLVLLLVERQRSRIDTEGTTGRVFTLNLMLVLGSLFCTVAGYFAIVPLMEAARAGQSSMSFATLHAVSGGFFVVKGLLVLGLAWRLTGIRTIATTS